MAYYCCIDKENGQTVLDVSYYAVYFLIDTVFSYINFGANAVYNFVQNTDNKCYTVFYKYAGSFIIWLVCDTDNYDSDNPLSRCYGIYGNVQLYTMGIGYY